VLRTLKLVSSSGQLVQTAVLISSTAVVLSISETSAAAAAWYVTASCQLQDWVNDTMLMRAAAFEGLQVDAGATNPSQHTAAGADCVSVQRVLLLLLLLSLHLCPTDFCDRRCCEVLN
jgi:hypothetical protein